MEMKSGSVLVLASYFVDISGMCIDLFAAIQLNSDLQSGGACRPDEQHC